MKFRLIYKRPLGANANRREKQDLRRRFLPQLRELWNQSPLKEFSQKLNATSENGIIPLVRNVGGFKCLPLISSSIELVASLEIILLRPEEPGRIVTQTGDVDNRLKTLLDALQIPKKDQIPPQDSPQAGEDPFYCLLEDDNLITTLSVTTDRLLVSPANSNEVFLLIHVVAEFTHQHFTNIVNPPRV